MHSFNETGTGVPAFLAKLWRLVDDPETNNLICWSKDGRSFIIQNQAQFARELLPLNYKHNNMASFIRQLNMYGFHKVTSIDNGGLKFDRDEMEFSHPCFKRNCPYLLEHIKRKIANTKSFDDKSSIKPEAVSKVLQDVKAMRGRQDSLDSRFSVMKQENEALWREIASLRQKHAKQQQIVNKLIQFLITIVQPSRNMTSVKRHMQLMLNDTPDNEKLLKTSDIETECGPVIHELDEELVDDAANNELNIISPKSPFISNFQLEQERGSPLSLEHSHSSVSTSQNNEYSNQSEEEVGNGNNITATCVENNRQSIMPSVTVDGSKIVYHVIEVRDIQPRKTVDTAPHYTESNILSTPLVREEIARSQLLKQKNKQRRGRFEDFRNCSSISSKLHCYNQQKEVVNSANEKELKIKTENEIDPSVYLNDYSDNRLITSDAPLISSNGEDSYNTNSRSLSRSPSTSKLLTTKASFTDSTGGLYTTNDFMTSSVPSVIFEDLPQSNGENSKFVNYMKALAPTQKQNSDLATKETGQIHLEGNTIINGKSSSLLAGNNNMSGASTSAAAVAASTSTTDEDFTDTDTLHFTTDNIHDNRSIKGNQSGYENALAMTKYHKSSTSNSNDGSAVLRLSAADEVHGHLENMQDELESLKDLLRGDGYSVDANILLSNGSTSAPLHNNRIYISQALDGDFFKLFNDPDILGPYGLSMNDNPVDRKGSEVMACQPFYDLSDIMDINNKSKLDNDDDSISNANTSRQLEQLNSELNTPHHE